MNLPISSLQFVDVENNRSHYIVPHFVSIIEEKAENETKSFVPKSLIELYTEDSSNGDTAAMMKVAMMYLNGERVEKNVDNAIEWFTKAVDAGEIEAMCKLGHIYEDDLKDFNKAFEWFMKGAEKGDAQCMYNVGRMHYEGNGTDKNTFQLPFAIEWLTKAAENGQVEAMYKLGHIYEEEKDFNWAFEWFKKGAEHGDAKCMSNVGRMYNDGKGTVRNNSLAIEWWTKASENGRTGAMCQLAFYYFLDEKNYEKSFEWYKKAAEYGDAFAMFKLGLYYYEGIGTERNIDLATRWLTKNTEKGEGYADDHALILLGRIYNEELHDYKKSFEFYQKASQSDTKSTEYMYYLGLFYYEGKGTTQNKSLAIDWLVNATTYNNNFGHKAMNKLGHIYNSDKDYKDDTKAVEWYKRAANAGDIDSMFDLGLFDYINKNKEDFWLHQAAEEGHITAMFVIALIYSKKHPDKWFERVTQEWYKRFNNAKPLHTNDVLSYYYSWSHCYYKGIGVQKNIEMAIQYMKKIEDTLKNSNGSELNSVFNVLWGEPPIRRILYELGVMYEGAMDLYDKDFQQKTNSRSTTDFEIREIIKAVEESRKNALLYYKSSAELDYIPAIAAIIRCYVTRTFGSLDLEKSIGPWMDKGFKKQKNGTEYNMLVYAMQGKKWSLDSL